MTKWNRESLLERFYEIHKGLYSYGDFEYKDKISEEAYEALLKITNNLK